MNVQAQIMIHGNNMKKYIIMNTNNNIYNSRSSVNGDMDA